MDLFWNGLVFEVAAPEDFNGCQYLVVDSCLKDYEPTELIQMLEKGQIHIGGTCIDEERRKYGVLLPINVYIIDDGNVDKIMIFEME